MSHWKTKHPSKIKGLRSSTVFNKCSYGFKVQEYRDTIIYLVAGGLKLPQNVK